MDLRDRGAAFVLVTHQSNAEEESESISPTSLVDMTPMAHAARFVSLSKPRLAQDLEGYIGSMPAQLRIFWKDAAPKSSKNAKSAAATVVQSASGSTSGTPSATPSRAQSPVLSKVQSKSKGKSSLSQSFQPETQQDMAVDSPPAAPVTIAKPENMPIAESKDDLMSEVAAKPKKVKKRKKAGAGDDIDAIFAGL